VLPSVGAMNELPMFRGGERAAARSRDLARGWNVLLFWGGPLAWILVSSVADQIARLSFEEFGVLLVIGTVWFGAICLVNALRCGRSHCWIDGTVLPPLAVIGGLNLAAIVRLSWSTYLSVLWLILIGSIVVECIVGSYPKLQRP
jgi:hypothetical protein